MKLSQGTEKGGVLIRLVENFSKRNLKKKGLMRSPRGRKISNWSHLHEYATFFGEIVSPANCQQGNFAVK